MKKIVFLPALLVFLLVVASGAYTASGPVVIAVIKSSGTAPYQAALEGFKKIIRDERPSVLIREYDLDERNVIGRIMSLGPDLVMPVGTPAAKLVVRNVKDIPVVFSLVLDPAGSGLEGRNLTGSSLDIPIASQFDILKMLIPGLRTIGVIYNLEENEHVINRARRVADDAGLVLVTFPVASVKMVPRMEEIYVGALWLVPDRIVCRPAVIRNILVKSLGQGIPVMGISPHYAKAGALLAVCCDYWDIGRQAGETALRVLDGENPADVPVSVPRRTKLYLNSRVAEKLGIVIPGEIANRAEEIFGR